MKINGSEFQAHVNSHFISISDTVSDIGDGFLRLTGYSKEEVIGRHTSDVLTSLLKLPLKKYKQIENEKLVSCLIFTKSLGPREVLIYLWHDHETDRKVYNLIEKPDCSISDKLIFGSRGDLQQDNFELERRVGERTAELRLLNEKLEIGIIERKQAEEELRMSKSQLEDDLTDIKLFQSIGTEFLRQNDKQALYEKLVDVAAQIMHSQFASMQMLQYEDDCNGELRLLAYRGFTPEAVEFWRTVGMESKGSTCGEALRTIRRVIVSDVEKCDYMQGTASLEMFRKNRIRACQTTPLLSQSGKLLGMISTHWSQPHQTTERELSIFDILARQAADLIEYKQAEEALRACELRLEKLTADRNRELEEANRQKIDILESISDCFYALDKELCFIYVNKAAEEIWGLSRADLIGRKIEDVFASLIDISLSKFRQVLEEQIPQHYEVYSKVIHRWGDMNVYPTRDGISVYYRDTTERKRAEEALRVSEERQAYLLQLSDALRSLTGAKAIRTAASSLLARHLQVAQSSYADYSGNYPVIENEMENDKALSLKGTYKRSDLSAGIAILCSGRDVIYEDVLEYSEVPEELRALWISLNIRANITVPIFKDGGLVATFSVRHTSPRKWSPDEVELIHETAERTWAAIERVRAEEALQESVERLRALVTASSDVVYRMSPDWSEIRQLHGRDFIHDSDGPNNTWIDKYIHPDDKPQVLKSIDKSIQTKSIFELEHRIRQADGTLSWTFSRAVPRMDPSGNIVEWVGAASDITMRKQIEEALRESEEKYRTLFNSIDEGFCIVKVIFDVDGKPTDYRFIETNSVFEKQTGLHDAKGKLMRDMAPDNEKYWYKIYGKVALTGKPVRVTNEAKALGRWYDVYAFPTGEPGSNHVAILFNDITAHKRSELEKEQLLKEKNEALENSIKMKDEFLATITHEFKTPLTVINAALQAIENIYGRQVSEGIKKHLHRIRTNSFRQLRLVNNLLDITRYNAGHVKINRRNMDIVFLTRTIVKSVDLYAKQKGVALKFLTEIGSREMAIDEEKYERILLNLLSNAIKFTPRDKSINVHISCKNRRAIITVKDEGVGIPKAKQKLIFERFGQVDSSLTRQAEGTGIGLSLVKTLVEEINGTITVDSEEGMGSAFVVTLPITKLRSNMPEINDMVTSDIRVMQATAIEFSDIYCE